MTTWVSARDAMATLLGAVTITVPLSASIKAVYKYRDQIETDFPCVVMPNPPGKRVERGPSGYRVKLYDVVFQILARDSDMNRGAEILDAFEEAIIDAFDSSVTLGLFAGYHVVSGPNFEPAGMTTLEDASEAALASGTVTLKMVDAKNFIG